MDGMLKILEKYNKFNSYINDIKSGINPIMLSGLTNGGKVHLSYSTSFYCNRPLCIITYNELQARELIKDLKYYTDDVYYFPKRDITTYDYVAKSHDVINERIECLNSIYNKKAKVIVTTAEASIQKMITKDELYKETLNIKLGENYNLEEIKEKLVKLGYERFDVVEGIGQFSVRGGIVDISYNSKLGIRIEFWGDEVDSIRYFNLYTQHSTETIDKIDIFPANEFVLVEPLEKICYEISKVNGDINDIDEIRNGQYLNKVDKYFNEFYKNQSTIVDFLDNNYIIFLDEANKIRQRIKNVLRDNELIIKDLIEKNKTFPEALETMEKYEELIEKVNKKQTIYLESQDIEYIDENIMHAKRNGYRFNYREVKFFRSGMDILFKEILEAKEKNKKIIIIGGSKENCKKISKLLFEKEIQNSYEQTLNKDIIPGSVTVTPGIISTGFESYDFELLVISLEEIFTTNKSNKKSNLIFKNAEQIVFDDLKVGDYVVHKIHGIGQYVGVNTIKADNVTKDYIKIKYKNDDILYVPTNQLDNIKKYVGVGDTSAPPINSLADKQWSKTTKKVKSSLKEVAKALIELYAKRENARGYAFSKDTPWQIQFENSFPYKETDDQIRCIEEMKKDMESPKPMDRLLCGDVGYGKTEVAIRGAFKACMDQKQVAYLVPTTILANQQYESFKERMEEFPIRVDVLNRFRTRKEQLDIIKKLKLGEIDIIIGTHRLLSKDIEFKDLGLLIVDEEQRFGVKAKEKIKELKNNVDVLTMSATPIPRTLHMSIVGIRDMSVIYEPPQNRKPVQTFVLEYDPEIIREAIMKELERGGQVFYLYNNVANIQVKANEIQDLVPESNVVYAHGQMTGKQVEDIMEEFIEGKTNVLVCTTILESGIDIPNANTIIVENADRLGLAQLYQIRGRVGRSDKQAYAYITYRRDKMLSEVADKRLKAIKEFTEFGSGFKVAMRDLEIRGAGSILGELQHGHLAQVGYDMYCKILDEVIKEMQGIEVEEELDVQIDINVSSYIPDEFIDNSSQKIEIYQNIALCKNEEDIQEVLDDIIDRYGNVPREIINLLDITRIKNLCKKIGIVKILQKKDKILYYIDEKKFNLKNVTKIIEKYKTRVKFSPGKSPYITYYIKDITKIIDEINEFLRVL